MARRVSKAAGAGLTGRHLKKYRPLIPGTSVPAARYTSVSAPAVGDINSPFILCPMTCLSQLNNPLFRAKLVNTPPGLTAFEVTPVDAILRPSSKAKRMLASLDFA